MLEQIELTARGQSLTTKSVFVASNLVNEIKCSFDTDWDVDEIRAVFSNDARGKRISVVLENNECFVPHEVLEDKGMVSVNLVGSVLQGEELLERMTSYKTCIIEVKQKVYVDGANSSPPTPEVWEQEVARLQDEIDGKVEEAPSDDVIYGRQNNSWVPVGGEEGQINEVLVNGQSVVEDGVARVLVPTKTSDIENDSEYVSDADYVHTDNNYTDEDKTKLASLENYDDTEVRELIASEQAERESDVDNLQSGLNAEAQARQQATNTLQSSLNAEAQARQQATNTLQANISAESNARQQAVNTLQANINAEAQARAEAVDELADLISAEAQTRATNDTALGTRITNETTAREESIETLDDKIDEETTARQTAVTGLGARIDTEVSTRQSEDTAIKGRLTAIEEQEDTWSGKQDAISDLSTIRTGASKGNTAIQPNDNVSRLTNDAGYLNGNQVDAKVSAEATLRQQADNTLQDNIDAEETARETADGLLQNQIDAITSQSDVVDVVGTYAELEDYDKPIYKDDIVKVMVDESRNNAISYYRLTTTVEPPAQPQPPYTWAYIGSQGPFYTKSEADALFNGKVDKVAGKGLSTNDYTNADKTKLAELENYDDTVLSGRVTAIENKESGWDAKADISDIPTTLAELDGDATHRVVTDAEKSTWNNKQNAITDLEDIRTGAELGATAVQDDNYVHTDNNYTTNEKTKLGGIEAGAEVNDPNTVIDENYVHTDNNFTTSLKNKLNNLENYDDTALKGRVSAIESKEDEWDAKADIENIPTTLAELTGDSTHRVVTDAEKSTWNNKQNALPSGSNDTYLHRNASTGAIEWIAIPYYNGEVQ